MTTDTIKLTNLGQITYPAPGTSCREELEAMPLMTKAEKEQIALRLLEQIPSGAITFKLPMPRGIDDRSRYFGHVRYVQAFDAYLGLPIGRMDLGYGEGV